MITTRQIERLWIGRHYVKLFGQLIWNRPEAGGRIEVELSQPVASAALALIRLDELNQAGAEICRPLLRAVLAAQQPDGGWGTPMTTALCLRSLMTSRGTGDAVDRAIQYLAELQKPDGLWPRAPLRRTEADVLVSAYILYLLGSMPVFASRVRLSDCVAWFDAHTGALDVEAQRLWRHASLRCRRIRANEELLVWS